jgi:hypothetical protein
VATLDRSKLEEADSRQVCIYRHQSGDWGVVDEADKAENEFSLKKGFRLLSAYILPTGVKIWIITERDRSVTTILLPSEY